VSNWMPNIGGPILPSPDACYFAIGLNAGQTFWPPAAPDPQAIYRQVLRTFRYVIVRNKGDTDFFFRLDGLPATVRDFYFSFEPGAGQDPKEAWLFGPLPFVDDNDSVLSFFSPDGGDVELWIVSYTPQGLETRPAAGLVQNVPIVG